MAKRNSTAPAKIFLRDSVNNQNLFATHYLAERLPLLPEWQADLTATIAKIKKLYSKSKAVADKWNEAQTESDFIRPALNALGWDYIAQASYAKSGKRNIPDYALFADAETKKQAYLRKDKPDFYSLASAVCDAKYWGRALDAESPDDSRDALNSANPGFQIINYLVSTDRPWGILTNGKSWRLYAQRVRSRTTTFLEIDLSAALEADDDIALRLFVLFFREESYRIDPALDKSFLDRVFNESVEYAVKVQDELKALVFEQVAPLIVTGFVAWRQNEKGLPSDTREALAMLYKATLVVLYRLLFLFYAESRNLLPMQDTSGYGQLSLARLCRNIAQKKADGLPFGEISTLIWDNLASLFRVVAKGDPALRVPVYNGGLFADKPLNGAVTLQDLKVADRYLADAIDLLARRYDKLTDQENFIDYKDLDVRHLGSIYEGLLEFQPRLEQGKAVLVNDKGQRKSTGSYYTPDYVVKHIVANTLGPVVTAREERFRDILAKLESTRKKLKRESNPARNRDLQHRGNGLSELAVAALLDIRVCDPAMGSGHFLVEAVGYLTDRFAMLLSEYPANPIIKLIEQMRQQICDNLRAQGIEPDLSQLDDKHLLKRMVIKRCIYGVDLNLMAVELAKLALWLDSFTIGAPLSFLNHHLRHGNSLIGTRAEIVQRELEVEPAKARNGKRVSEGLSQGHLFGSAFSGMLNATSFMRDIATLTDATLEEVEQSAERYALFEKEILPYKRVLDIWLSHQFGVKDVKDFLRLYGQDALSAVMGDESKISPQYREAIHQSRNFYAEQRFFHWDLEFPEVFVDLANSQWGANPGFDAIISNPPYVDVSSKGYYEKAFACGSSGNLYAYMLEISGKLIAHGGRLGVIVPLSLVCSERMGKLRKWVEGNFSDIVAANFGIRPAKIFPNVDQRVTILFARRKADSEQPSTSLKSTGFNRWHEGQEQHMIANLAYADIGDLPRDLGWPKLGDEAGRAILHKLSAKKNRIGDYLEGDSLFFYHGIGRYWLKAYDFAPVYLRDGEAGRSTTLFELSAQSNQLKYALIAILNSSLFFWFWSLYSDDFHLMREEIASFPFACNAGHKPIYEKLQKLAKALMRDYKKHSTLRRSRYPTGEITLQEFYPRKSKAIIDQIDDLLGMIYGLSKKEVEYIKSYDVGFRTDEDDE